MITALQLRRIAPWAKQYIIKGIVDNQEILKAYKINTPLRICHFIAQIAHESAHFKTLEEYASGAAYEGRKDLGNTERAMASATKGAGISSLQGVQTTSSLATD